MGVRLLSLAHLMFDTHCHLNFSRFKKNVDEVIRRAKNADVTQIVIPGTDIESSKKAIEIAEKFLRLVEDAHIDIQKAVLFGSHARGTAGKWSDIDIALVSPSFSGVAFYDSKMLIPYVLKVDSRLELHPYRPEDFTDDDPFVKEIVRTGVGLKV